jgi:hypothetical protein
MLLREEKRAEMAWVLTLAVRKDVLRFDGVSGSARVPALGGSHAVSFWLWLASEQRGASPYYLLDGRQFVGDTAAPLISSSGVSAAVAAVYSDAAPLASVWAHLPRDVWTHVLMESAAPFSSGFVLMSSLLSVYNANRRHLAQASQPGYVEGRLADVAVWARAPTSYERLVAARVDVDVLSSAPQLALEALYRRKSATDSQLVDALGAHPDAELAPSVTWEVNAAIDRSSNLQVRPALPDVAPVERERERERERVELHPR